MECLCNNYECLEAIADPCDNTVELAIAATETDTWEFWFELNGGWTKLNIDVTLDLNIEIPNILNENYVHLSRFIDSDGNIVNDTCYKLSVKQVKTMTIEA